jgi:hypothetical protein
MSTTQVGVNRDPPQALPFEGRRDGLAQIGVHQITRHVRVDHGGCVAAVPDSLLDYLESDRCPAP